MDDKQKIIIKEILVWKENHMLPEQYCDYLLSLYSQGEEWDESSVQATKGNYFPLKSIFVSLSILIVSLFVLYFTEMSFPLQTAILVFFVVVLLTLGFYFSKKGLLYPMFYIVSAILLLVYSVELHDIIKGKVPFSLHLLLFMNCLLWWVAGKKLQLIYFTISAWLGLVVLVIFIFI
ncbi:YfhO family protein [Bacillus sp. REN10]|uniref:YfhO family protein n=1 Tax=Bacillus sp. REN10 TaxID=2782541 RepID=UPI001EEE95AD|nr:YfhO family protein [Bacillus sp. REN10]